MSAETEAAVAEASQSSAVKTNTSATEFALRRAAAAEEQEPVQTELPEPEPEAEEDVATVEDQLGEQEPEPEAVSEESELEEVQTGSDDVLSKLGIDLDSLSRDDYDAIAKAIGGRAGDRIRELTWRAKTAEEKLAQAQQDSPQADPLASDASSADNPFSDLKTVDDLKAKAREVDGLIEWAEEVMDDSSQYGPDEEVTSIDGKPMTKREVRETLKNARKARNEFLPSQLTHIQQVEAANRAKAAVAQKATKDFPWLADEKSELTARYAQIAGSPEMRKVYADNPMLGVNLPYLLAAGVERIYGQAGKPSQEARKETPRKAAPIRPPAAPSGDAAAPSRAGNPTHKAVKELEGRFKTSGRMKDFIKLRTQSHGGQ